MRLKMLKYCLLDINIKCRTHKAVCVYTEINYAGKKGDVMKKLRWSAVLK